MKYPILAAILLMFLSGTAIAEEPAETSLKEECERMLTLVKTGRSPEIYGAVYYPRWKEPKDGLKSVAAEMIAEHAREKTGEGIKLELASEPVVDNDIAGVLLKRSGGDLEEGVFPVYLFRDERNGWGFLGFPIPMTRPAVFGFIKDSDDKFYEDALNDPTPYDGVLYEFDDEVKKRYLALTKKLEAMLEEKKASAK